MTADQASLPPNASPQRPFQFGLKRLIVVIAVVALCLAIVVPLFRMGRAKILQTQCALNPYTLAIALHNYHDTYRQFPPPRTLDAQGNPAHSWRVLLLPFVDERAVYQSYQMAEPWNGPTNSIIAGRAMPIYRCPADGDSPSGMTNYVAIVGDETMWSDSGTRIDEITDGASNTLMLVEISHSNIHWMEPRDLPIEELDEWLDPKHRPRLFGNHIEGGMVAYADGSVELLSRDVTIERLRALASRAGNDMEAGRETKP